MSRGSSISIRRWSASGGSAPVLNDGGNSVRLDLEISGVDGAGRLVLGIVLNVEPARAIWNEIGVAEDGKCPDEVGECVVAVFLDGEPPGSAPVTRRDSMKESDRLGRALLGTCPFLPFSESWLHREERRPHALSIAPLAGCRHLVAQPRLPPGDG
jgi:hypothetical protein